MKQKRQRLGVTIQHQKHEASTALTRKEAFYENGLAESRKKMKHATVKRDTAYQQWHQRHRDASEQEKNAQTQTLVQQYMGFEREAIYKTKKVLHITRAQKEVQNNQTFTHLIEQDILQLKKVDALYQKVGGMLPPPKASQKQSKAPSKEQRRKRHKGSPKPKDLTKKRTCRRNHPAASLPSGS